MADDERVLTSFVLDEETLVDTWAVTGVDWGTSRVPPATVGEDVVALTDRRFMWFEDELAAVDLGDVEGIDRTDYSHTSAPTIVRLGWAIFGLALLVTAGLVLLTAIDFAVAVLPTMTGLTTLLVANVVARVRGETGTEVALQRVVVETTTEDPATVWGEGIEDLADAIERESPESGRDREVDEDEAIDDGRNEDEGGEGNPSEDSDAPDDGPSTADAARAGERDGEREE